MTRNGGGSEGGVSEEVEGGRACGDSSSGEGRVVWDGVGRWWEVLW